MPVLKNDICMAAELSRLDLTTREEPAIFHDMALILGYMDQIKHVKINSSESSLRFEDPRDVLRKDKFKPSLPQDIAVSNAPDKDEDFFRVPRVLG